MSRALRRWSVACAFLAIALPPRMAEGQEAPRSRPTVRLSAVFDAEVCACDGTTLPTPRLRDLVIVALGRRIPVYQRDGSRLELAWVPEVPLLFSSRTADGRLDVYSCGPRKYCSRTLGEEDVWTVRAFGAGIMPLAFSAGVRVSDRVRVRGRASAGALQVSHPVPLAQGTKFNFIADGAASVELLTRRGFALSAGLGLNHISNGGLGRVNLGMDSHMFEIGVVLAGPD